MFNIDEQGGEAKAVGWISMSDMFMLCSIVMLGIAVIFAASLQKTDLRLTSVEGEYAQYKNANTLTIDELKDKSAKFRSQSENLANELSSQAAALSSVQSEFAKYRSANSATIGELKLDLTRMVKEAEAYKTNVAALNQQVSSLEGKLAGSEKEVSNLSSEGTRFKTESGRLIADLEKQRLKLSDDLTRANGDLTRLAAELTRSNGELARVNGELTLLSGERSRVTSELGKANSQLATVRSELTKLGGDKDQLLADYNSMKLVQAGLQKEDKDLKLKLATAEDDKKIAEAKLSGLQGTISTLTGEIGDLQPQLTKLKIDLSGANLRIIDLEKLVFEKINRAKLVVTISADDVPKDYTLELFVTDPMSNECGPFSAVIFNEGDEIGVLQQSIDFKGGKAGSQKAVFYSMRPVYSRMESGSTYTVKAMIRRNGNEENTQLPHPIMVNCSVDLPNISGPDAHQTAQLEITSSGYIKKVRRSGALTSMTAYKNMWPWEPVYHYERYVCDFQISGDRISNFRTFEKLSSERPVFVQAPSTTVRGPDEQRIDSIRNRSGN